MPTNQPMKVPSMDPWSVCTVAVRRALMLFALLACLSCGSEPEAEKGLCEGAEAELFTTLLGGAESDIAFGMTRAKDGGIVLVGRSDSLGQGMNRGWLARTDRYGRFEWGTDLGPTSGRADVIATNSGGYLLAHGALQVVELDAKGVVIWEKSYPNFAGKLAEAASVTPQVTGGALVAGTRYLGDNQQSSAREAVVLRIAEDGSLIWGQTYVDEDLTHANDIIADGSKSLIVGWTASKVSAPGREFWAAQLSSTGDVIWSKRYGGLSDDEARAAAIAPAGGYVIAGMTRSYGAGDVDMWVVRVDEQGKELWNRTYGDDDSDEAYAVAAVDKGFIMTGRRNSFGLGPGGLWLLEIDDQGEPVWQMTYGAAWKSAGHAIEVVKDGYVVGGTTRRKSKGSDDFWILRSDRVGKHKCPGALCYGEDDLSCGMGLTCDAAEEPFQCVEAP